MKGRNLLFHYLPVLNEAGERKTLDHLTYMKYKETKPKK